MPPLRIGGRTVNLEVVGLLSALAGVAFDQASKIAMLYGFHFVDRPGVHVPVTPFFDLVMVWNHGISYGLFQADGLAGTVLLTAFSLTAMAVLTWWLMGADRRILALGLGLIIGGALGNVIDRILYGAVADFFYLHAFGRGWYVFNIADVAIGIGVLALLVDAFGTNDGKVPKREPENRSI